MDNLGGNLGWFLASVVTISLSGVLMPGPVFAATVAKGHHDAMAGAKIGVGHGIVEFPVMFAIYFGFGGLIGSSAVRQVVGIAGGAMLLFMGYGMIRFRRREGEGRQPLRFNAVSAGILTTLVNPYWFLWWATIGTALLLKSLGFGLVGFLLAAGSHWLCDFFWGLFISQSVFRTRRFWTRPVQQAVLAGCGSLLLGFGVYFLWTTLA